MFKYMYMFKYEPLLNTTKRNVLIKLSRFITIINYYCKSSHFSLLNTVHSMYFYCISIVTVHTQLKLYDVILMYFTVR